MKIERKQPVTIPNNYRLKQIEAQNGNRSGPANTNNSVILGKIKTNTKLKNQHKGH